MTDNSHKTAKKRATLSRPMRYLHEKGLLRGKLLDYGCGRGDDAERLSMDKYDPCYFSGRPIALSYDTITCNYVLNVIKDESSRKAVLSRILRCLKPGGTAYISVRRDKFREGVNARGTFQATVELDLPVLVEKKGKFITYILKKQEK